MKSEGQQIKDQKMQIEAQDNHVKILEEKLLESKSDHAATYASLCKQAGHIADLEVLLVRYMS